MYETNVGSILPQISISDYIYTKMKQIHTETAKRRNIYDEKKKQMKMKKQGKKKKKKK
jgi:hypothetical protein